MQEELKLSPSKLVYQSQSPGCINRKWGCNRAISYVHVLNAVPVGAQHGINNIFHELWILNDQDYDKAAALIESEFENPEPGKSWICSDCSEENEGNFEVCWKCQRPFNP